VPSFLFPLSSFLFFLLLASCATAPAPPPETVPEEMSEFSALPQGGELYLSIDVPRARPFLEVLPIGGLEDERAREMIARTEKAAAVFFSGGDKPAYFAAVWGDYPRSSINFGFTFSPAWSTQKSSTGGRYWRSRGEGLSLAVGSAFALVSTGDPFAAYPQGKDDAASLSPEGFDTFRAGAVLSGWVMHPGDRADRFLAALELPLRMPATELSFALFSRLAGEPPVEQWEVLFRIRTPTVSQAKAIFTLFSMAHVFARSGDALPKPGETLQAQDALMLFFREPPFREEVFLTFRSGWLDQGTTALLFRAFPLYSGGGK
jgi:hypothetical protein